MKKISDNLEHIAFDLTQFADPFTETKARASAKGLRVSMVRNGRDVEYIIDEKSGRIALGHRKNISFSNLNSLLASEEFADLLSLSRTQLRAIKLPKNRIPVKMLLNGEQGEEDLLFKWVAQKKEDLHLGLLDGPAGIGKTFQIEASVVKQAEKVIKGAALPPLLHVSSKGRRLSNLNDVLAWSTQSLGAKFGARHVPMLVRRGLLIVAIDGFDELVDADGYEDAWSALGHFVKDIGSTGTLLLAARDTFVDEQELLKRIGDSEAPIDLDLINIRTTDPDNAKAWLRSAPRWKASDVDSETSRDILVKDSYTLRPFFLQELKEARGWKEVLEVGPRTFLINRYVKRESTLIAKQLGVSQESVLGCLMNLFEEIALQMGEREIDWVEVEQLAFMTEYAFDGVLENSDVKKLAYKAGSFALLEVADTSHSRSFPHSEIRNYFLGRGLMRYLAIDSLPAVLRRGVLNAEHMEVFSEVIYANPAQAKRATSFLVGALRASSQTESYAANAGALALLASSQELVDRLDYLDVADATFAGGSPTLALGHSHIGRLDARGSDLSALRVEGTKIETLVVDTSTRITSSLTGVESLEVHSNDNVDLIRGLVKVQQWLSEHAITDGVKSEESAAIQLMDKLARRVIKHYYLRERGGDDEATFMLQDESWPKVKSVLERHHRLQVISNKQMKGRNSCLYRILQPRELLDRENPLTREILRDLS